MVEMRDIRRAEARKRKVLAKLGADQQERVKNARIRRVLNQMRQILRDEAFIRLVHAQGVRDIPTLLVQHDGAEAGETTTLDRSLDFVVAWRFFSPLLYEPVTADYLDTHWPGFGLELRDIFIAIVADGPFPQEQRGRGRRMI